MHILFVYWEVSCAGNLRTGLIYKEEGIKIFQRLFNVTQRKIGHKTLLDTVRRLLIYNNEKYSFLSCAE